MFSHVPNPILCPRPKQCHRQLSGTAESGVFFVPIGHICKTLSSILPNDIGRPAIKFHFVTFPGRCSDIVVLDTQHPATTAVVFAWHWHDSLEFFLLKGAISEKKATVKD